MTADDILIGLAIAIGVVFAVAVLVNRYVKQNRDDTNV